MKKEKETEEKVFTNWTVKELLGQGAFGKVYRIEREEFGSLYQAAMKKLVIPQSQEDIEDAINEGMDDKSVTSYFKSFVEEIVNEFKLMSQLKGNTNIVSYEDHMVIPHEDGIGWDIMIRMELLKSLKNATAEKNMTEEDVIRLGIGICNALEICGKMNIIHRDIKPENIFVTSLGEYKLGDFGIARTAEKTMSNLSKKGTYTYMAPEVYKGEAYNATVDIYSLGLVMYRLMNNNRAPFLPAYPQPISFSDREAALTKRISDAPMPAPAHGSKELKRIILKACAYSVSARYHNPVEMREELQKLLKEMDGTSVSEPLPVQEAAIVEDEDATVSVVGDDAPAKPAVAEPVVVEDEEDETVSMFTTRTKNAPKAKSEPDAAPPVEPRPTEPEPVAKKPKKPKKKKKKGLFIGIGAAVVALLIIIVLSSGGSRKAPAANTNNGSLAEAEIKDDGLDEIFEGIEDSEFTISSNKYLYGHYFIKDFQYNISWDETFFDGMDRLTVGEMNMAVIPVEIYCFPEGSIYKTKLLEELLGEVAAAMEAEKIEYVPAQIGDDTGEEIFETIACMLFGDKVAPQIHNFYVENIEGQRDTAELTFVDELKNRETRLGYYKMNGSTMEFAYLDLDGKGNLVLRPVNYEVSFSGKNLNISSGGTTRTLKPAVLGYTSTSHNLFGYANSVADAYEGISYLSVGVSNYDFSAYFTDGWCADKIKARLGEDNTFVMKWEQETKLGDPEKKKRVGEGTLSARYLDCGALGLIIKVDGKDYFYQKTETEYYAGLVGNSVIDSGLDAETLQRMGATQMEMLEALKTAFEAGGLTMGEDVLVDEQHGTITLNQGVLFDVDSYELSEGGKDYLARIFKALDKVIGEGGYKKYIDKIIVEGHTDSDGNYEDNQKLSENRAASVDDYCGEVASNISGYIKTVGRSSDELIYDENGNEDKDASRRVVLWVTLDAGAFVDKAN